MAMVRVWEKVKNGIFDTLFPAFCVNCGKEGRYICEKCYVFAGEAALICSNCTESSFTGETHAKCKNRYGLDGLASAWEYEGVVKKTLGEIKYQGITHAVQELMAASFQMMAADQARFAPFFEFLFAPPKPRADARGEGGLACITYVPMFLKKEKKRGFNQAKLIAQELKKISGQKVMPLLKKIKDTKSQTELTKEERQENVKNSFALRKQVSEIFSPYSSLRSSPRLPAGRQAHPPLFQNLFSSLLEKVVLVDDIYTTGVTMKECCKILKKAGVKEVWGFTLARTP